MALPGCEARTGESTAPTISALFSPVHYYRDLLCLHDRLDSHRICLFGIVGGCRRISYLPQSYSLVRSTQCVSFSNASPGSMKPICPLCPSRAAEDPHRPMNGSVLHIFHILSPIRLHFRSEHLVLSDQYSHGQTDVECIK